MAEASGQQGVLLHLQTTMLVDKVSTRLLNPGGAGEAAAPLAVLAAP